MALGGDFFVRSHRLIGNAAEDHEIAEREVPRLWRSVNEPHERLIGGLRFAACGRCRSLPGYLRLARGFCRLGAGAEKQACPGEQSESGNIGAQAADAGGHIAFALNPTILVAVAQIKGPGELELSLVTPDGRPVGAAYTLELEVA